ncbi:ABC transporter permease [Paenibacillus turpanensis]|uniref:ABC transporter permease n=1 Tax=Paenibacillus turpanensis TaxID=2689078 RepID=UPI001409C2BC|nr:ABC transporter permease [Paenibacillus turpanensis]
MKKLIQTFTADSILVPLVSILLGLLFGALVMLLGGYNPIVAYGFLIEKVFGDRYDFGETVRQIAPLIFTGLSVAFAFRTGLFNIGAEGQFIMGMTGAIVVGVALDLPWFLHAPLAVIVGALLAGFWGAIAGYLKAARGVNEVITTIMLNWIALYLANYIIRFFLEPGQQRTYVIDESASLSIGWLSLMFDSARLHWGIPLSLVCAYICYVLLWKTKQGFELRAVGFNPDAAQYAGMNVGTNVVRAMFIAGIFAGLAGVFEGLGVFKYQVLSTAMPGYGFDGIAVALLGANHPLGVVLGAMLFGGLTYGSSGMSFGADVPPEIIRVVIGSVIFFVAAQGIVRWLIKPALARKAQREVSSK